MKVFLLLKSSWFIKEWDILHILLILHNWFNLLLLYLFQKIKTWIAKVVIILLRTLHQIPIVIIRQLTRWDPLELLLNLRIPRVKHFFAHLNLVVWDWHPRWDPLILIKWSLLFFLARSICVRWKRHGIIQISVVPLMIKKIWHRVVVLSFVFVVSFLLT